METIDLGLPLQANRFDSIALPEAALLALEGAQAGPTLQSALREAGAAPGAGGRGGGLRAALASGAAGLGLIDLWHTDYTEDRESDGGLTMMSDAGDGTSGDGWSEITVTGTRPKTASDPGTGQYEGGGTGGSGMTGETGGGGEEPLDCTDRNAIEAQKKINNEPDKSSKEHGSIVYVGAGGAIQHTPPIEGKGDKIYLEDIEAAMKLYGITYAQMKGFVHSHASQLYGDINSEGGKLNRYPSGGSDVGGGDWASAGFMVSKGAGGPGGAEFSLYIIDGEGKVREFPYSQRDKYENLNYADRVAGDELPAALKSDGSTC